MEKNKHTKYFYNCENVFLSERCHILGKYRNTVEKQRRELKPKYNVTLRRFRIIPHRTLIMWLKHIINLVRMLFLFTIFNTLCYYYVCYFNFHVDFLFYNYRIYTDSIFYSFEIFCNFDLQNLTFC